MTTKTQGKSLNGIDSATSLQTDNSQLSPFVQLMSTLQQLQQSDPAKYQQVTGQIATNLQNAVQAAQSDGNSTAADQLNKLATDFTNASQSGQLPNVQDVAQAIGGGHHHHHHAHAGSSSSSTASGSDSRSIDQLLSAFQTDSTQSDAIDPMSIIFSTLQEAGITGSGSNR